MLTSCAFCASESLTQKRSLRTIFWKESRNYFQCSNCSGFTLLPKLIPAELEELYSDYYLDDASIKEASAEAGSENWSKKYVSMVKYLQRADPAGKSFLDFGCGVDGYGLQLAQELGLEASGMEISSDTRKILKERTRCTIFSPEELDASSVKFDFILLSDVLEHDSDPDSVLAVARKHMTPGGILLIQGPLEGTKSFTNLFLNIYSLLTPKKVSFSLPYHVSLANRKSITALLTRGNMSIEKLDISETWWPAPKSFSRLSAAPKVSLQIFAKLLDFTISFFFPSYGSRFWMVASTRDRKTDFS